MKKIIVTLFVATVAMTSCKKDYTCECTNTSTIPGSGSTTSKKTIADVSKSRAKSYCVSTSSDMTIMGSTYTSTSDCSIK